MFKKTIAYLILLIIITFTIAACEESVFVSEALEVDLTSENKDFFYNSGMLRIKSRINGVGPLGFLFHTIEKIKGRKEVKTIDENLLTFPTCVNKYFFIKEDGEFQYMLEFTPGCQWLGELYSGSYLETGKFTLNESDSIEIYGHATYNDFSSNNWTINGSYEYCGSALIDGILIDDGSILLDEDDFNYSSNIHFSFDLTEIFINENQVITIFSNGYESEHFIDEGILIEQQEIISTIQSGPTFSTWIKEPFNINFACNDAEVYTYTKGVQSGQISLESVNRDFSINYGIGLCDNIINVASGEDTFTIDLQEEYEEFILGQ